MATMARNTIGTWGVMWDMAGSEPGRRLCVGTYRRIRTLQCEGTRMRDDAHRSLSLGTRRSHSRHKEKDVSLLASRFNHHDKASAQPLAVARAVPNDLSRLRMGHAHSAVMTARHSAVVRRTRIRTTWLRPALATASGLNRIGGTGAGHESRAWSRAGLPSRPVQLGPVLGGRWEGS